MKIEKLRLLNFRNHRDTSMVFSPTINFFTGPNGQGKTNILESIAYLSLGKSFFSTPDNTLIQRGFDEFIIHGNLRSDDSFEYSVGIRYSEKEHKKEVHLNGSEQEKVSSLIGRFPMVILHPDQHRITNGGPVERRRFVDIVLSQAFRPYFELLLEYRRVLQRRNALLSECKRRGKLINSQLEPWDEALIDSAIKITDYRAAFVKEFQNHVAGNYKRIVQEEEYPEIVYQPSIPINDSMTTEEKKNLAREIIEKAHHNELIYGTTLCGPHRDELLLAINGLEVRKYASQGQQKTFLVAIKISEFHYLYEKRNEQPIILLDDLFGELDSDRAAQVVDLTIGMGQTFVTSADDRSISSKVLSLNGYKKFYIDAGAVVNG